LLQIKKTLIIQRMPLPSIYPNAFNACLVLLQRRGYTIRYEKVSDAWFADGAGFVFRGDNPTELLGLAAIHEDVNLANKPKLQHGIRIR
jgi:hypothetical protein